MFQHEVSLAAFEDAQKQVDVILGKLRKKTASIVNIQIYIEKKKLEVLGARKVEQVCVFIIINLNFKFTCCFAIRKYDDSTSPLLQECIKEQDALIPIEQASRQKVAELKSILDTEKSQGSVLKPILQAKESNRIERICGRMGDRGAIDGKSSALLLVYNLCFLAIFSRLTMT